jgi:hypothetical protein
MVQFFEILDQLKLEDSTIEEIKIDQGQTSDENAKKDD